jgi:hypothetical protein
VADYSQIRELVDDVANRLRLEGRLATALYASAGTDTRAITFTGPEFFEARHVGFVPSPNLFIYIDRRKQEALHFEDASTSIKTVDEGPLTLAGALGRLLRVRFESATHGRRECVIALLREENAHIAGLVRRDGWAPDVFIGVTDGCRFGGNDGNCVNDLRLPAGLPPSMAREVLAPRWWITDHFPNHRPFGELRNGDYLESKDPEFPMRFRKLALLSSDWGRYASPQLRGATLFACEPTTAP